MEKARRRQTFCQFWLKLARRRRKFFHFWLKFSQNRNNKKPTQKLPINLLDLKAVRPSCLWVAYFPGKKQSRVAYFGVAYKKRCIDMSLVIHMHTNYILDMGKT